ncbi:MAG: hypothetical protein ABIS50_23900 [Luteolibacter sp.]|uniref:hypothetical protein n=1 Tax=Luteolibacter sp. TaxID=1962973 RepID=UPI0032631392
MMIWSGLAGACLMLGLLHLVVWCRSRQAWASFWLSVTAFGVIGILACEVSAMYTDSPAVFERAVWWGHLIFPSVCLGVLGFVHCYLGTGRPWLFGLALGMRLLAVVGNLTTGSSLHFIAIHSLKKLMFFGRQVSVPGV